MIMVMSPSLRMSIIFNKFYMKRVTNKIWRERHVENIPVFFYKLLKTLDLYNYE